MADLLNSSNLANLPDVVVCGYDDNARRIRCHDTKVNCAASVFSWTEMREEASSIDQRVPCPTNYVPYLAPAIMVGDATLEVIPSTQWWPGGVVKQDKLPCAGKGKRYLRACGLPRYGTPDEKARCYMGKYSTEVTSRFGNTLDRTRSNYGYAEVSKCPIDWQNPTARDRYMNSYCGDSFDGVNGTNELCNEWWDRVNLPSIRDAKMLSFCSNDQNRNHPSCACINAAPKEGTPSIFSWAFDNRCGDAKNKAYRTQGMRNLTYQNCSQIVDITRNSGSSIRDNQISQTCTINFPDLMKPPAPPPVAATPMPNIILPPPPPPPITTILTPSPSFGGFDSQTPSFEVNNVGTGLSTMPPPQPPAVVAQPPPPPVFATPPAFISTTPGSNSSVTIDNSNSSSTDTDIGGASRDNIFGNINATSTDASGTSASLNEFDNIVFEPPPNVNISSPGSNVNNASDNVNSTTADIKKEEDFYFWYWIIVIIICLLAVAGVGYFIRRRNKNSVVSRNAFMNDDFTQAPPI